MQSCVIQGRKRDIQSAEADDITVWIISYIIPHDYVLSLKLNLFLSYTFDFKTFDEGVSCI